MSEELLPYKVLKPISYKGDRVEKDAIVKMTPEEAENIGDEFLEPFEENDSTETSNESADTEDGDDKSSEDSEESEDGDGEGTESEEDKTSEETDDTQTGNQPEETV